MTAFQDVPYKTLRWAIALLAVTGLAGCIGYNSPLAPPAKEPVQANCAGVHGHWLGTLDDKADEPLYLVIGDANPEHEAILFLAGTRKPEDWLIGFLHPTAVAGRTYLNLRGVDLKKSRDTLTHDSEWLIFDCAVTDGGARLELRGLDSKKQDFFAQAGIAEIKPDKLGEALAEYLRRFGADAVLSRERFVFRRVNHGQPAGG